MLKDWEKGVAEQSDRECARQDPGPLPSLLPLVRNGSDVQR